MSRSSARRDTSLSGTPRKKAVGRWRVHWVLDPQIGREGLIQLRLCRERFCQCRLVRLHRGCGPEASTFAIRICVSKSMTERFAAQSLLTSYWSSHEIQRQGFLRDFLLAIGASFSSRSRAASTSSTV